MRAFNKTAATLVRPHPFSTLCTTPLGKMWVCKVTLATPLPSPIRISLGLLSGCQASTKAFDRCLCEKSAAKSKR